MKRSIKSIEASQNLEPLKLNRFKLEDRQLIQTYIDTFHPESCEYNFSNLYVWQDAYKMSWTLYQERLLIYDGVSKCAFMPLGKPFQPEDMVVLALILRKTDLKPVFNLLTSEYLKKFPKTEDYFDVKKERNDAEYVYLVESLCELTGPKLHKKRNLIAQFKRLYPDFQIHSLNGIYKEKALSFSQELKNRIKTSSKTLDQEMKALERSFYHFEDLGLEGLVLTINTHVIAFSIFSKLSQSTYDIQFEKADREYKGAAQVINHEAAKLLRNKCQYLNREQDLGIMGLRQAKLSYDPVKLITPYRLVFTP